MMGVRTWRQLLAGLLASAVLAPAGLAEAAQGRGQRTERGGWPATPGPAAYDRGYREGVLQGEADARSGRPFNRQSTARDGFGTGFADGYRAGYDREHARAPMRGRQQSPAFAQRPSRGYQEPAFAQGYDDGYEKGVADGRDGERYDPVGHRDYREADQGYARSYGTLDAYKNNYRAGFRQGYEQGYREGTRHRR
jgi:hypothetical protein